MNDHPQLRIHLCWGNWHGPHHHDIDIEKIFKVIIIDASMIMVITMIRKMMTMIMRMVTKHL